MKINWISYCSQTDGRSLQVAPLAHDLDFDFKMNLEEPIQNSWSLCSSVKQKFAIESEGFNL